MEKIKIITLYGSLKYIGDSVKEEIAFAKSLNKEIIYLENPQSEDKKD